MKLLYRQAILTLGLLLISIMAQGQERINPELDTIQWEYRSMDNQINGDKMGLQGQITSYSGRRFVWKQQGMDRLYVIEAQSAEGKWKNVKDRGKISYQVVCNGEEGTLSMISDTPEIVTIILNFEKTGKSTPHVVLKVSSYRKL